MFRNVVEISGVVANVAHWDTPRGRVIRLTLRTHWDDGTGFTRPTSVDAVWFADKATTPPQQDSKVKITGALALVNKNRRKQDAPAKWDHEVKVHSLDLI